MDILNKYPIVSDQVSKNELAVVLGELQTVLKANVSGDVVEMGCYKGTTSLFIQRLLAGTKKQFHVYDSFEGLPPKTAADTSPLGGQFKQGELRATKAEFITNFKKAGLPLPVAHKGWFSNLGADDIPPQICFAFLDGDFYESIKQSLELVWPRLATSAIVVVDDYSHQGLPGVRKAVGEWVDGRGCKLKVRESLAILTR